MESDKVTAIRTAALGALSLLSLWACLFVSLWWLFALAFFVMALCER